MQKIKQDEINIGANIRAIRLSRGIGQTELVRMVQLQGVDMTRECLVKIERGIQHVQAVQPNQDGGMIDHDGLPLPPFHGNMKGGNTGVFRHGRIGARTAREHPFNDAPVAAVRYRFRRVEPLRRPFF